MRTTLLRLIGEATALAAGGVVVDSKSLLEPNLRVAGKKPVGLVEIDYSHPASKGLTDCLLQRNGKLPRNIGRLGAFDNKPNYKLNMQNAIGIGGTGWSDTSAATNNYFRSSIGAGHRFREVYDSVSVMMHVNFSVLPTSENSNFFILGAPNGGVLIKPQASGGLSAEITGSTTNTITTSTGVFVAKKNSVLVMTHGARDGFNLYVDGVLVASAAYGSATGTNTGLYAYIGGLNVKAPSLIFHSACIWNKTELTQSLARSLSRDPYQFLKPAAQVSDLAFIGTAQEQGRIITASGALNSASASISGNIDRIITVSGALTAAPAEINGNVGINGTKTASGALIASPATMAGNAKRIITGSGALNAAPAIISGASDRIITVLGDLSAQASEMSGIANRVITSSGNLIAEVSIISGTSKRIITVSGNLVSVAAEINGTIERTISVSGSLESPPATINGAVDVEGSITASGNLISQPASINGTGKRVITVSGILEAQSASINGSANIVKTIDAAGALVSQPATMSGTSVRKVTGSGALVAEVAQISGGADVIPGIIQIPANLVLASTNQTITITIPITTTSDSLVITAFDQIVNVDNDIFVIQIPAVLSITPFNQVITTISTVEITQSADILIITSFPQIITGANWQIVDSLNLSMSKRVIKGTFSKRTIE